MTMRAAGRSWGEITTRLGFAERSSAQRAVQAGIERSQLLPGVRHVLAKRMTVLHPKLMALDVTIAAGDRDDYDEMEGVSLLLMMCLTDACTNRKAPPGVRDVEGLLHHRRPHEPAIDPDRDWMLQHRALSASLDQIRTHSRYRTESGVAKRLDTEIRRSLLAAAAQLYFDDLEELRDAFHTIDLALRRSRLDPADVRCQLERIEQVALRLELYWHRINGVEKGTW